MYETSAHRHWFLGIRLVLMTPQRRATIDPFTLVPIRLDMKFRDMTLATGTCFIYQHNGADYMITNRHNVTGRHNETGKCLDEEHAAIPDHLVVHAHGARLSDWKFFDIPLYTDTECEHPKWLIHPTLGGKVDVVAIPLPSIPPEARFYPITDRPNTRDTVVDVASEVFIIGFPERLSGGLQFPIWKRATLASEPDFDIDDLPRLLVDSATRPGMSGSPVIWIAKDNSYRDTRGVFVVSAMPTSRRIGIYSGRASSKVNEAQIGYVWKDHVIVEIIDGGVFDPTSPYFS